LDVKGGLMIRRCLAILAGISIPALIYASASVAEESLVRVCPQDKTLARNELYCASNNQHGFGLIPQSAWLAYNNSENSNSIDLRTYTETMKIVAADFPNHVFAEWSWPMAKPTWNVYAFANIVFGDNGGYTVGQGAGHPVATQVKNFNTLTSTFSYTYTDVDPPVSSLTSNFSVIFDLFLTSIPYTFIPDQGTAYHIFELIIYVHPNWIPRGRRLFTYSDAGVDWDVHLLSGSVPAITARPRSDVLSGTFDFKGLFQALVNMGVLSGNEYVAGISFGAEPACCHGSITINSLNYNWQNK
jgi:hypothetical protein